MSQAEALRLIEEHVSEIVVALFVLSAVPTVLKWRARWNRLGEAQARQRAVAASMGFRRPGPESRDAPLDRVLASLVDAPEKLGPFPRLVAQQRIQIQFEGQHAGMQATIALHKRWIDEDGGRPSTLACFVSPDIGVSAFTLGPADKPNPELDDVLSAIERVFRLIGWRPRRSVSPIEFPGRTFNQVYKLESDFTVSIRDDFDTRALTFFEKNPGWRVEGLKGRLLVWREDVHEPTERIPAFLSEAAAAAEVFRRPPRGDG